MSTKRFVAYYRVSTDGQKQSGLGLDAQKRTVHAHVDGKGRIVAEYVETESGKRNDRPKLAEAIAHCRLTKSTLIVAKVDRLARNSKFLLSVVEAGDVVFCDLPQASGATGKFLLSSMAAVAELEAGLISERTRSALAEAKARGTKLGGFRGVMVDQRAGVEAAQRAADAFAAAVAPMAREMRDAGRSLRQIAAALTEQAVQTPRGGDWSADAVKRVLARA